MSESLHSMTTTGVLKQHYYEFEQARNYCLSLSEKLGTIDKISRRIHKERTGTINNILDIYLFFKNEFS